MNRQVPKDKADILTKFIDMARRATISIAETMSAIDALTDKGIIAWRSRETRHLAIKFRIEEWINKN